jgi:hypothetical protein
VRSAIVASTLLVLALAGCPKKSPDPDKPVVRIEPGSGSGSGSAEPAKPAVDPWCANRPEKAGPYVLDAALAAKRRGTGAKTYADADSAKDQPVEICGIQGARDWLDKTKCPDGTDGEQLGRFGAVGRGGRCQSIIDKYKVRCPDGTIDVYMDVFFCGPGESM